MNQLIEQLRNDFNSNRGVTYVNLEGIDDNDLQIFSLFLCNHGYTIIKECGQLSVKWPGVYKHWKSCRLGDVYLPGIEVKTSKYYSFTSPYLLNLSTFNEYKNSL